MDWLDEIFNTEQKKTRFLPTGYDRGLIKTSTIPAEENEQISKNLNLINYTEAEQLINYLQTKQVNRILAGLNYNMSYVKWFMKKTI